MISELELQNGTKMQEENHNPCIWPKNHDIWLVSNTSLADMEPVLKCIMVGLLKDAFVVAQKFLIDIVRTETVAGRHFVNVRLRGLKKYHVYGLY